MPSQKPVPEAEGVRGWQLHAGNTGIARLGLQCDDLPVFKGGPVVRPGTVIERQRITSPLVLGSGVQIRESCLRPTSIWPGQPLLGTTNPDTGATVTSAVTIRDSEIDGSLLSVRDRAITGGFGGVANLLRNHVHHVGSGISLLNTGYSLSVVVEGNYVSDLAAWGDPATDGNHSDGFTIRDFDVSRTPGRTALVVNNRFVADSGNDTGAFFLQTYGGDIGNVTIAGNLLEGNGWQLGLEAGFGNGYGRMEALDNRFSGTGWGAAYVGGGARWTAWQDNFVADAGSAGHRGRAVRNPRS